jgi:nucleoside-diphosphate-sugar epimerase
MILRYRSAALLGLTGPRRFYRLGMRLLVLGGTAWLGRCVAATALERGHDVTCLARGESGEAAEGITFLQADRDEPGAYDEAAGHEWDAVIDVARQPGHVRCAVEALAGCSRTFAFVSSASVYADDDTPGADESAPVKAALEGDVMETMDSYGEAKVACEQHVLRGYGPDRSLIVRAGLIGGPGDVSDRTGYWPLRFSRPVSDDGRVLVPDVPDLSTQVLDVRDLALWLVESAASGRSGTFNAMGDPWPLPVHLEVAREVAGHTGPLAEVDQEWLLAHDVEPWMGKRSLPLWLPLPDYAGFGARSTAAARAAGLEPRPLGETLVDALTWEVETGPDRTRKAGLSADDELALLHELAS